MATDRAVNSPGQKNNHVRQYDSPASGNEVVEVGRRFGAKPEDGSEVVTVPSWLDEPHIDVFLYRSRIVHRDVDLVSRHLPGLEIIVLTDADLFMVYTPPECFSVAEQLEPSQAVAEAGRP